MCPDENSATNGPRGPALIAAGGADPSSTGPFGSTSASGPAKSPEPNSGQNPRREEEFLDRLAGFARQRQADKWSGTFAKFLETVVRSNPQRATRTSHQYVWDMLRSQGQEGEKGILRCTLLSNELFGIDDSIARVLEYFKAAAAGSEVGRRLLLLLGPPSGGKSTAVILLKRGLEEYSHTDAGALYAIHGCPVHESPLHLVPHTLRAQFRQTHGVEISGELCPFCTTRLATEFGGDFMQVPV